MNSIIFLFLKKNRQLLQKPRTTLLERLRIIVSNQVNGVAQEGVRLEWLGQGGRTGRTLVSPDFDSLASQELRNYTNL